jgi:hypothetical protein
MKTIIAAATDTLTKDKLSNMKIIVICVQTLLAYNQVVNHINKLTLDTVEHQTNPLKINKVIFCLGEEKGNQPVENLITTYRPLLTFDVENNRPLTFDVKNVVLHPIDRGETSMTEYSKYTCEKLVEAFNNKETKHETFNPITMS